MVSVLHAFEFLTLPFGAVRSVHAFLRLARAIWWIGVAGCGLLWTSFSDDFMSLSKPALVSCTANTVIWLFKLLGWSFAEEGDKCVPFASVCETLGVSFDLRSSGLGIALVCNIDSKVTELCSDLQKVIDVGIRGAKQAQRLRGRMQFAETQMFGRTGRRCLKVFSAFAEGHNRS